MGGVADTAVKFISGLVDTAEQFFGGVVDTGDNFSPESLTLRNSSRTSPRIFEKIQKRLQWNTGTWGPGGH